MKEDIEKILDSVGALATEFDENARYFWIKYKTPEVTDQILTLLDKEIHKARVEQTQEILDWYALMSSQKGMTWEMLIKNLNDRIKQLEKGE